MATESVSLNGVLEESVASFYGALMERGKITFSNTASKLDEVQVGKLFERFFTVEAARNSTGLGLAIAKTLVEQMNGEITAKYWNQKLSISIVF